MPTFTSSVLFSRDLALLTLRWSSIWISIYWWFKFELTFVSAISSLSRELHYWKADSKSSIHLLSLSLNLSKLLVLSMSIGLIVSLVSFQTLRIRFEALALTDFSLMSFHLPARSTTTSSLYLSPALNVIGELGIIESGFYLDQGIGRWERCRIQWWSLLKSLRESSSLFTLVLRFQTQSCIVTTLVFAI